MEQFGLDFVGDEVEEADSQRERGEDEKDVLQVELDRHDNLEANLSLREFYLKTTFHLLKAVVDIFHTIVSLKAITFT